MKTLWRILVGVLASIGAVVVLLVVMIVAAAVFGPERSVSLPDRIQLRVDIDGGLSDRRRSSGLPFERKGLVLREVAMGLQAAAADKRVAAVAVHMGGGRIGLATAQELRAGIEALRAAGKPVRLFTEDLGGIGGGSSGYYLASAADEIWIQPSGGVGLIGIAMEIPYARGLLEKLEVQPRFGQRHEYKSAVESITRNSMSEPVRANLTGLLESLYGQMVSGIAASRGFQEAEVRRLVDQGPYLAEQALERRLIDRIGYWDEFIAAGSEAAGEDAELVSLENYLAGIDRPNSEGPRVALIYGSGAIGMGGADYDEERFGAQGVAQAFADAVEDKSIKAILFRIDSPGGSYVASDIVWREVRRASAAGKPVIVSMGATAASGGYFVAMGADSIVAQPATITGSIGVYGGKLVTEKLWASLGIAWDELHAGENAGMWSFIRDFPAGGEARFREMLDFIYADFTAKAMADRGLETDHIDRVARGRVWTGEDALEHGLVDALGGYGAAIGEVRRVMGLAPDDSVELVLWPRPKSPLEEFASLLEGDRQPLARVAQYLSGGEKAGALAVAGEALGLSAEDLALIGPPSGMLQMPPMRLRY